MDVNVVGVFSVFVCVELVGLPGSALGALKTGFMPIKKNPELSLTRDFRIDA